LVSGLGSVLLCAENWGMLGVDWLFGANLMNGSQMGEFGQIRGFTGRIGEELG